MKLQKKLCILCPYPFGVAPSQRLKYEQYISYFEKNNLIIDIKPFMSRSLWDVAYLKGHFYKKIFLTVSGIMKRSIQLFSLKKYDCVYVHLWVTPFGSPLFEWMTIQLSKNLIYDIDDLIYLKPASKTNPFLQLIKSGQKPIMLMKHANHVITCTPHLDAFVRKYNNRTTDISSTINTDSYQPVNNYSNDGKLTLGWSGSFSTSKYLTLLKNVLVKLQSKYELNILVIGDPDFSMEGLRIEAIPWNSATEIENLQRIDIGLYPLPNEEWVLGKSGLKALQYMALGIPTVATKIGANHRVIEDGISGFLVESDEEWLTKLEILIKDNMLRKSIGEKARERVELFYSIKANRDTYLDIIQKNI